jgi:hypothetical protein
VFVGTLMPNANSADRPELSLIFDLWFSQWRLAVLHDDSMRSILALILNAMIAKSRQDPFWQCVQQFFESSTVNIRGGDKYKKDSGTVTCLMERAMSLPPHQARYLLKHLSNNYSISGEGSEFWSVVVEALKYEETQQKLHSSRMV